MNKLVNIAPANSLAKTEQMAVSKGLDSETSDFAKAINQYRYVISAQQVEYVRDNYSENGKLNDEDALVAYLSDGRKYSTDESARLHKNRDKYNFCRRITCNKNSPIHFSGWLAIFA